MSEPATKDTLNALQEAQMLLAKKQYADADAITKTILDQDPNHSDALYTYAVSLRLQKFYPESLQALAKVIQIRPNYSRAIQEQGHNHMALKDYAVAKRAFQNAVEVDPSLIASWEILASFYRREGDDAKANEAVEQIKHLKTLPEELRNVVSYLAEGAIERAERLCRYFLRSNKTHVEGMRLLAEIATRQKMISEAEFILESAVSFEPDNRNARAQYGNILLRSQKFGKAFEQASLLMKKHPDDMNDIKALYAAAAMGIGNNAEANKAYHALLKQHPDNEKYAVSLAHLYKSDGDFAEAVKYYQRAYKINPTFGDAYWSLANTKAYNFSARELEQMSVLESSQNIGDNDKVQLCFALGKGYEDVKDFAASFKYYNNGTTLKKKSLNYDYTKLRLRVDAQINTCTKELFAAKKGLGLDRSDPIFIVGLPRAGSTLLEQILSSHSLVDGTLELHNILNLSKRLRGRLNEKDGIPKYPKILNELDDSYFVRLANLF